MAVFYSIIEYCIDLFMFYSAFLFEGYLYKLAIFSHLVGNRNFIGKSLVMLCFFLYFLYYRIIVYPFGKITYVWVIILVIIMCLMIFFIRCCLFFANEFKNCCLYASFRFIFHVHLLDFF